MASWGEQFASLLAGHLSSIMSKTWWFARVRDTNAIELFMDNTNKGEIEYLFANAEKGNKKIDVSKSALTES